MKVLATLLLAAGLASTASAAERDPDTGLLQLEGWELVRAQCTACHSADLITQQRGSRERWLSIIRWMQATQNLWAFPPATEARILDYLARAYPPARSYRRPPLPARLLPPAAARAADREARESDDG